MCLRKNKNRKEKYSESDSHRVDVALLQKALPIKKNTPSQMNIKKKTKLVCIHDGHVFIRARSFTNKAIFKIYRDESTLIYVQEHKLIE